MAYRPAAKQAFLHIHRSMKPLGKHFHRGILATVSPNRACIRAGTLGSGMTRLPTMDWTVRPYKRITLSSKSDSSKVS